MDQTCYHYGGRVECFLSDNGVVTGESGEPLGTYKISSSWVQNNNLIKQIHAVIQGKTYVGRQGQGQERITLRLREIGTYTGNKIRG